MQNQSQPLTQLEVYKHLLQVAENIIDSLVPDPSIITKYETLKKAMKSKIKAQKQQKQMLEKTIASMYRTMCQQVVATMAAFESEMEEKQLDPAKKPKVTLAQAMDRFKDKANREIKNLLEVSANIPNTRKQAQHMEQLVNQEISEYQYLLNQISAKLENLTLLQQIHAKMQEIIHQAASRELARQQTEKGYLKTIDYLEQQTKHITDAQAYVHKYQVSKSSIQQIRTIHKQIQNILQLQ